MSVLKLSGPDIRVRLAALAGWTLDETADTAIQKTFDFSDYFQTIAFVNAVAAIANRADHHPDLGVHYGRCVVRYGTHAVGGVTEKDIECARQIDAVRV